MRSKPELLSAVESTTRKNWWWVKKNIDNFWSFGQHCNALDLTKWYLPPWLCRKGSNVTWRRAAVKSFPLQLTYRTTSSCTRSRWGSGWSAPTTPQGLPSVARGASAGRSSRSTRRSTSLPSRPKLYLGKYTSLYVVSLWHIIKYTHDILAVGCRIIHSFIQDSVCSSV